MEQTPTAATSASPVLSADADAILTAAGYTAAEAASLRGDGVVA